ncbi:hypothetical protein ACHAXA_004791 [Cyclostephanos tholiformis]|uniref:Uncharacterized protein n=1 Tax=Cyclostephanos tholiformis TaxID=382380 RepID=A0ABD3RAA8_9STRA
MEHASSEFIRLLAVAGMEVPPDYRAENVYDDRERRWRGGDGGAKGVGKKRWTLSDHFLHELGIDPNTTTTNTSNAAYERKSAYFGRSSSFAPPPTDDRPPRPSPPTYSHPDLARGRRRFMNSIPWDKFARDYDNAFEDARADWTTMRLGLFDPNTVRGRERREELVSRICAGVRIRRAASRGGGGMGDDDRDDAEIEDGVDAEEDDDDDVPEGLDVIAQLIAMRRLSILLYDNFDRLKMEKMGRMWERLVIVLTPPRRGGGSVVVPVRWDGASSSSPSSSPLVRHPGRKLTKYERRRRRRDRLETASRGRMRHDAEMYHERKRGEVGEDGEGGMSVAAGAVNADEEVERGGQTQPRTKPPCSSVDDGSYSGFKFSYGTRSDQGSGHVIAHVPIDFRDGELVRQLQTHVREYFDNCCGRVGFLRYGADGVIRADVGDEGGGGFDHDRGDSHYDLRVDNGEGEGMGIEREIYD